mgnify:CR=1 FL=1
MKAETVVLTYAEQAALPDEALYAGLIASGYETMCPYCETFCELIEVPGDTEAVLCPKCGKAFITDLPEHAYP